RPRVREADVEAQPTDDNIAKYRAILKASPDHHEFNEAFAWLTRHDPGTVAAFLREGNFPDSFAGAVPIERRAKSRAYAMSSSFGVACKNDRVRHFMELLKSPVDFVRVAAAVYLCYEDEAAGVAELRKLLALPEEAGGWAALTLARRGFKDAMPR